MQKLSVLVGYVTVQSTVVTNKVRSRTCDHKKNIHVHLLCDQLLCDQRLCDQFPKFKNFVQNVDQKFDQQIDDHQFCDHQLRHQIFSDQLSYYHLNM